MTIMMDMELNHLTEEERDRILNVLRKDEELKERDAARIRKLKTDVKKIRLRGVIKAGMDPDKTCARCRESFGWIFNKGAICPQCQHKVCEKCREMMIRDPSKWLCILCYKQMELDAMSGQWFMQKFRRSKRNRKTNKVITGQEIVKASIRRHPQTDEEDGEEGAQGSESSQTGPNTEDSRKVTSNNNSSPKSSRSVGSNVEESSDTQSTASTSPGRRRPDVHDMGFPKESDKQRLFDLIRSKAPVIGKEEAEKPTVEVRKVSLSRYRSDSESSSSSGPSSPQLSARTESEFRYSDSIRSSIRSAVSGVSMVSSEGRMTMVTESNISDIDSTSFASLQSSSPNLNSPRQSCSSLDKNMYDKETKHFKSSDSVIENPAHRHHDLKLTTIRTDTNEGPVILEDTEVTVRRVKTSKHADSMSSDSDAEDNTRDQANKVKFRRISAGKGQAGRSRSPSPDPRSRSRPIDLAANTMSSPETVSNRSEIGSSRRDGQAGGVTNSSPTTAGGANRSREYLSHSQNLPDQNTHANHDFRQVGAPASLTGGDGTDGNVSIDEPGNNNNHNIRDKVSVLLAKYGRTELLQNIEGNTGADKAISGEGASASSVSEISDKNSQSSESLSSYDIIDMDSAEAIHAELEWDSDMLTEPNTHSTEEEKVVWDEQKGFMRAKVTSYHHYSQVMPVDEDHEFEGRFLDDEVDVRGYVSTGYEERTNIWARTHCQDDGDDDSDGLSVITEHTEPDEERDMLISAAYDRLESLKPTRSDQDERDQGYFTLPSKGAVSRTESMRSAGDAESEASHTSITPSSDYDNYVIVDSDLSMISEASGTESAQDIITPDSKTDDNFSYSHITIEEMVAKVLKEQDIQTMHIDDLYVRNLKVLDENDLHGLKLPLSPSVHPNRDLIQTKKEDGKKKSRREHKVKSPTLSDNQKKIKATEDTDISQSSKIRRMEKSTSDSALLKQKEIANLTQNSDLKKQRDGLRKVHKRSRSEKGKRKLSERDEKKVDESHVGSISDLTKMFDKPPPYYNAKVVSIAEVTSTEVSNDVTDGSKSTDNDSLKKGSIISSETNTVEEIQPSQALESEGQNQLELSNGTRRQGENKMESNERAVSQKSETKSVKVEKVSKSVKDREVYGTKLNTEVEKDTHQVKKSPIKESPSKRSPSPTVKAVKEKVEGSKSIQLREIICAELEREVLCDVSDYESKDKNDYSLTDVDGESPSKKPTQLSGHNWMPPPSPTEVEVEKQLDAWKKRRERRRKLSPASSDESIETKLKVDTLNPSPEQPILASTPLDTEQEIVFLETVPTEAVHTDVKEVIQISDSASGSDSIPEKNVETGNTSDELEEAFLRPRVPTPGGELDERSQNRPHHHYIINEGSGELMYVDTEATLTPDPDLDSTDGSTDGTLQNITTPSLLLHRASSDTDEDDDKDSQSDEEEPSHLGQPFRHDEDYEDGEELSFTTGTSGSIGRSSYDGNSTVEVLSVDAQESASLRSSAHSSQYSPGSGSYGSGEGEVRLPRWSQHNHLKGVCVSYDSLDVLVDEESDTAEERLNPAMVEEDVTLSLDLGPRPEPYITAKRNHAAWVGGNRPYSGGGGGGRQGGGGGGGTHGSSTYGWYVGPSPSSNTNSLSSSKIRTPIQSVPRPAYQEKDAKQSNGHSPGHSRGDSRTAETSSLTESETGSTGAPSERSSHRDKSSISSVPSINVTHHDNENKQESPVVERGRTPEPPVDPPGSSVDESEEAEDLISKHATSPTHSMHSQKSTGLLSPFSGSKESIVSFYSDAGEGNYGNIPITGEILFGLEYNYKTGSLEVKIKQCRDLAPVDTKKKRSDPYVKVYLLPDKTKSGKRKTRVKKHTLSPVFDETVKYSITKSELETRTLWVTVWHSDMFGRNDFLGEVTIPLDYYAFDEPGPQWYKLQERNASPMSLLTYKGDLMLSLKYVTADNASTNKARPGNKKRTGKGEMHVLIKEARNLTAVRANGFSDPFCKGYLLPDKTRGMKQKTPVVKRDCNPQWNHTLVFEDLTLEDLKDRSLELTVWDHDRFTSNDFLGGLRLNLGTGKIQGKEVDWMDSRGEEVSMWQSMLDRPNCWIDGSLMLRPNMGKRK